MAEAGSPHARRFEGVLLDWRGTLVVAPTDAGLARTALVALGRPADAAAVDAVLDRLASADATEVESSAIDTDTDVHRRAYASWFAAAGLDDDLAQALYAAECDVASNPFAADVGPLLAALHTAGGRVSVLSDIHVALRPIFAAHTNADGRAWADLVNAWVLSFEVGAAKPDPAIFAAGLQRLGLPAADVLMVGDRGAWDGAAAQVGITTLILPHCARRTTCGCNASSTWCCPARSSGGLEAGDCDSEQSCVGRLRGRAGRGSR